MKVRKVDPISGRVTYLEREQPLAEFRANQEILLPGDVYRVGQDYMDFPPRPEETEAFQMLPFYAGLRHVAGAGNPGIWDEIWDWVKNNIWDFLSGGKAGVDPKVLQAIQKVEAECGLTEDVKWAWAWYDRRYPKPLGNSWKGYCYYASQWALFPWDVQHYTNCATHCLNQIQNYLQAALSKAAGRPIGGIMDFLKKYGAYLGMGGLGLALIVVLARRH